MAVINIETKWFHYRQNNSGGHFDYDPKEGISVNVYVEARDAKEADFRAEQIGIYFDGIENGMDCDCCGDRWTAQDWCSSEVNDDVVPAPDLPYLNKTGWGMKWTDGYETFVHRYDGTFYGTEYSEPVVKSR